MATTTGNLAIGFRRMGFDWHQDLNELIEWTKENGFEALDIGQDGDTAAKTVVDSGLRVGSVDLAEWHGMISANADTRKAAIEKNSEYVKAASEAGPLNHFIVMLPEDAKLEPAENFKYMVDSFNELAPVMEASEAKLVIEGWPGPGASCCTPETWRAFFEQCSSPAMGINFDPSHLIRMGINHRRYVKEFKDRIYHIHGKDTNIDTHASYNLGHELPATFATGVAYGSPTWRYCIPGHGITDWGFCLKVLTENGYDGCISIELEDCNFNGKDEKRGINAGRQFLENV
ncbi:MAG: sugar phosphate isomerase/epimerase [Lentisphaeria bacterium]|nr:sugar phosphate isomerase/epimerase [Lentisphaeria bacterium]NQZ71229.1 sugar phosphate isomerase/epimerase [Lentisphaeria bacterium]